MINNDIMGQQIQIWKHQKIKSLVLLPTHNKNRYNTPWLPQLWPRNNVTQYKPPPYDSHLKTQVYPKTYKYTW